MSAPLPSVPEPRPEAPALAEAGGQILLRHLRSLLRGRRVLLAAAAASLPPLLSWLLRDPDPSSLCQVILALVFPFLLPLVALTLGTGLLHDEAEEGTLTFLFTSAVPRPAVFFGKWLAALVAGGALLFASAAATFAMAEAPLAAIRPFVEATFLALAVGYPAYLGAFALLGAAWRYGFVPALLYAYAFESVALFLPGAIRNLSLAFYIRSLLHRDAPDPEWFATGMDAFVPAPRLTSWIVLLSMTAIGVVVASWVTARREYQARNVQA